MKDTSLKTILYETVTKHRPDMRLRLASYQLTNAIAELKRAQQKVDEATADLKAGYVDTPVKEEVAA